MRNSLRLLAAGLCLVVAPHVVSAQAMKASGPSLYQRIGGYDAVAAVTDDFIGRLATDPKLGKFFAGHSTDSLTKLRQHVIDFVCIATGGPCAYTGRDMKTAHKGLGISEADWNAAVNHFVATLDKFKVPQAEKDQLVAAVAGVKGQIVER
jgi:hemoglobin